MDLEKNIKAAEDDEWEDPWGSPFTLASAYAERDPVTWLVDGIIRERTLSMVYGPPGNMKTFLALDLCLRIAAGLPWLPPAPWQQDGKAIQTAQVRSMYIDMDNGEDDMHERVEALSRALNLPADLPFSYYSFPMGGLNAGDSKAMGHLARRLRTTDTRFVVVDNLGIVKGKADENSDEMVPVMNNFRQVIEDTGCAISLIHHQRKTTGNMTRVGDSIRGHSSIEASLNLALLVEREAYSDTIDIKATKTRGGQVKPFSAQLTYTHKPNTYELESALFYGLQVEDTTSDAAISREVVAILIAVKPEKLNQKNLINRVKAIIPELGVHRIRNHINGMAARREILSEAGNRAEVLFYVV